MFTSGTPSVGQRPGRPPNLCAGPPVYSIEGMILVNTRTLARITGSFTVALALAAGVAFGQSASPSPSSHSSADPLSPAEVVNLILHDNPGLKSYKARAHLDIRQVNFPWLHPVLDGYQYYSQPGYTTYDFPHTPSYLKGITKVEGAVGLANRWMHCYDMSVKSDRDAFNLKMTPKIRGEVKEMDVVVDRNDGTIHHIDWWYWNTGDHVALDQFYGFVSGFRVVKMQQSKIELHHIRAVGNATFDDFQFNLPVPTPTPTPSDPLHSCDN